MVDSVYVTATAHGQNMDFRGYSVEKTHFIKDYFSQRRCLTLSKKQLSNVKVDGSGPLYFAPLQCPLKDTSVLL